jgi:hypothetical protein
VERTWQIWWNTEGELLKNFIAKLIGVKVAPDNIEDACKLFGVQYEPVKSFQDLCKNIDLYGEFASMDAALLRKVFVTAAKELRKRNQ